MTRFITKLISSAVVTLFRKFILTSLTRYTPANCLTILLHSLVRRFQTVIADRIPKRVDVLNLEIFIFWLRWFLFSKGTRNSSPNQVALLEAIQRDLDKFPIKREEIIGIKGIIAEWSDKVLELVQTKLRFLPLKIVSSLKSSISCVDSKSLKSFQQDFIINTWINIATMLSLFVKYITFRLSLTS